MKNTDPPGSVPSILPPPYGSPIYHAVSHLFTMTIAVPAWVLIRLCFQISVRNGERIQALRPPFLIVSNHQSILDSYFVCIGAGLRPEFLLRPKMIPFHTPDEKNFMNGFFSRLFHLGLRCIPISRGAGASQQGIETAISLLRGGNVVYMFPEGTRSRTGRLLQATRGVGRVVLESRCPVLPVYISGMAEVLPVGTRFPRLFTPVDITIGRMMPPSDFERMVRDSEGWMQAGSELMAAIERTARGTT